MFGQQQFSELPQAVRHPSHQLPSPDSAAWLLTATMERMKYQSSSAVTEDLAAAAGEQHKAAGEMKDTSTLKFGMSQILGDLNNNSKCKGR